MLRPRTALLLFLLLLFSSVVGIAGTAIATRIAGAQRQPLIIVLFGAILIVAAICLRHIKMRKRTLAQH